MAVKEKAEDVTAEIFVRLWKKEMEKPDNIESFLYTIAKNAALDYLRLGKAPKK